MWYDRLLKKNVVIALAAVLILILLVWVISNNALVKIYVTSSDGIAESNIKIFAKNSKGEDLRKLSFGDYLIIPKSTSYLSVYSEEDQAEIIVFTERLSLFNIQEYYADVKKQRAVEKISGDSLGCHVFGGGRTLNYNCGRPANLFNYDTSGTNWNNKANVLFDNEIISINNYKDGFLYTYFDDPGGDGVGIISEERILPNPEEVGTEFSLYKLSYWNLLKDSQNDIKLPSSDYDLATTAIVTDQTNKGSSGILLINRELSKLHYTDNEGAEYSEFSFPDDFNYRFDILNCYLINTKAYCYYGIHDHSDSYEQEEYNENNPKHNIVIYDFSEQEVSQYKLRDTHVEEIILQDDEIYFVSENSLYHAELNNDKANYRLLIEGSISVSGAGKNSTLVMHNALYKITGTKLERLFSSDKIDLTLVSTFDENIVVDGISNNKSSDLLHSYKINNSISTKDNPGYRIVDIIPHEIGMSGALLSIDYYNSKINAKLKLDTISDRETGEYSYISQSQYDKARQEVQELITNSGISTENYDIIYSY